PPFTGAVVNFKHLFSFVIFPDRYHVVPIGDEAGRKERPNRRGRHPRNLKRSSSTLAVPGKEVAGGIRRNLHPVIFKLLFPHHLGKVDSLRTEVAIHLLKESRMGSHQEKGGIVGSIQITAPPTYGSHLVDQVFVSFRMIHLKTSCVE